MPTKLFTHRTLSFSTEGKSTVLEPRCRVRPELITQTYTGLDGVGGGGGGAGEQLAKTVGHRAST